MRLPPNTDAWLSEGRQSAGWERRFEPRRSSKRVLIVITLIGAALLALLYVRGAQQVGSKALLEEQPFAQPADSSKRTPEEHPAVQPQTSQRIQRVAKCLSPTGAVTYSDAPCPAGARPSAVDIRPDSNLADGMSDRERSNSLRQNVEAAQAIAAHERVVAVNVYQAGTECPQLDALIAAIDSAARLPQPGLEQDRLREQRKRARDRQFALRCR